MKKLIIVLLLMTGCKASQEDIVKEARRQLSFKLACALLSVEINATGKVEIDPESGLVCLVSRKDMHSFVFYESEVKAISRYLRLKLDTKRND
jgi:uncharacterized protein YcfL